MKTLPSLLLSTVVVFALGCEKPQRPTAGAHPSQSAIAKAILRVPDTQFMGILPLYVADEAGYFSDADIEIQWIDVRDPTQAANLFFSGKADLIMSTFSNLAPAELRQPGMFRLLLPASETLKQPGSFLLVRPNSDITRADQLKGKKLGTYSGASQKAYALAILHSLGFNEDSDVEVVQVQPSAQVSALMGGSFDVLFAVEPYATIALQQRAKVIESGVRAKRIADPFWVGCAAVSVTWTADHKRKVGLQKALVRAVELIEKEPAKTRSILSKRAGMTAEVASQCHLYSWTTQPSSEQIEQMQGVIELLVKDKFLEKSLALEPLFLK